MITNRNILIFVFLILAGIAYFAFSPDEKPKKKPDSKKLGLLLSGSPTGSEDNNYDKKRGHRDNSGTLFDSDFMKPPGPIVSEDDGPKVPSEEGEIPINPQTGKPWEEDAMAQFDELRKHFVDNELIPKKMTRADKERQNQLQEKWNKAQNAVNSGTFTRDDLETHFSHQQKVVQDRLQIIEYLIESQKEDGEVDKDGQFQKILDGTREQMKQLENQKEELSKKLNG